MTVPRSRPWLMFLAEGIGNRPRPWIMALAVAVAAGAVSANVFGGLGPAESAPVLVIRSAAKAGWVVFLLLVLWQGVADTLARAAVAGQRDSLPTQKCLHGPEAGQSGPASGTASGAASGTGDTLPMGAILRRAALVCAVPLPRYLADPAGGIVAGAWLLVLVTWGYVYVEHFCRTRPRWARWRGAYWAACAIFLAPWAFPAFSATWPPDGAL